MRTIMIAVAAVLVTAAVCLGITTAQAAPPAHPEPGHVFNEVPYFCIALAGHGAGHRAEGAMCAGRKAQEWTVRGQRIVTASGLCLTAEPHQQVITARCDWAHGQRWTLMPGYRTVIGSHRIESQRFARRCLMLAASYTGPVRLGSCKRMKPVIDGGTGYWVTGQP